MFDKKIFLAVFAQNDKEDVYDHVTVSSIHDATSLANFLEYFYNAKCVVSVGETFKESEITYMTGQEEDDAVS